MAGATDVGSVIDLADVKIDVNDESMVLDGASNLNESINTVIMQEDDG